MTRQMSLRSQPSMSSVNTPARQVQPVAPQKEHSSASSIKPESYTQPFLSFISQNPTVFHAVAYFSRKLDAHGFNRLSERDLWTDKLAKGGKYYYERNGSGLIAFTIGTKYVSGNGAAIIASHVDALTTKLKPISAKPNKAGFIQLGIAPYAGALNQTWIDRDLGVGGRVFVKDSETGKIETKLVRLGWPIARIPSLAPHFGIAAEGQANKETRMVPIIGLDNSDISQSKADEEQKPTIGIFTTTQPPGLVKAIAGEMGIQNCTFALLDIVYYKVLIRSQIAVLSIGSSRFSTLNRRSLAVFTRNSSSPAGSMINYAPFRRSRPFSLLLRAPRQMEVVQPET